MWSVRQIPRKTAMPHNPRMQSSRRSTRAVVGRTALMSALVIGAFYLVPVEPGVTGTQLVLRTVGTVIVGIVVAWLIVLQVRHHLADPEQSSLLGLLVALTGGLAFFALADYITAVSDPGQFVELETKTDALYFALTTLTTVGYGDVHAAGQVARGVVIVQLIFNVVFIATGVSVLTGGIRARAQRMRNGPDQT
jgi:hypothetical protein